MAGAPEVALRPAASPGSGGRGARRARFRTVVPLAVATLIAANAGLSAITLTVAEPLYQVLVHSLASLGILLSLVGSLVRRSFSFLGALIMVLAFAAYAIRFERYTSLTVLAYPTEVFNDPEVVLSTLVGWLLVGFCFMQSRRDNLVFIPVSGLAVFGLMGTRNLNPELLAAFGVYLFATIYCWGYDHFLTAVEEAQIQLSWRPWARAHLVGAALLFLLVGAGAAGVGNALFYTTPRFYGGLGFQQRIVNWTGVQVQGYFLFREGFQVGTGPVRLSSEPMLRVKAAHPALWRGRVYDRYDGRGWRQAYHETRRTKRLADGTMDLRHPVPPQWSGLVAPVAQRAQGAEPSRVLRPPARAAARSRSAPAPSRATRAGSSRPGAFTGPPAPTAPRGGPRPPQSGPRRPAAGTGLPRKTGASGGPNGPGRFMGPGRLMGPMGPMSGMGGRPGGAPANMAARAQRADADAPQWRSEPLKGPLLRQDCQVITAATDGLFAAAHAQRVWVSGFGDRSVSLTGAVMVDSYGQPTTQIVMDPGREYTVWSQEPRFSPRELRAAPRGRYDEHFRKQYVTQTSLDAARALKPLVKEITAGATNNYDRARAIQSYLERNYAYTLDEPETPEHVDAVVYFVTHTRRGACDLFASAMTVMARLADIPARVVTGYATGDYDRKEGAYIVHGSDAHAWSELYFPGLGWVNFDPVAQQSLDNSTLLALAALLRSGQWQALLHRVGTLAVGLLAILVGLYLAASALVDPRPYLGAVSRRLFGGHHGLLELVARDYVRLLRMLARRARLQYRPPTTPRELIALARQGDLLGQTPALGPELLAVTDRFYDLRYGPRPSREALKALRGEISRVRRALRRARPAGPRAQNSVAGGRTETA